jgi:hypothetical protein
MILIQVNFLIKAPETLRKYVITGHVDHNAHPALPWKRKYELMKVLNTNFNKVGHHCPYNNDEFIEKVSCLDVCFAW